MAKPAELLDPPSESLQPADQIGMFERLAKDQTISVEKIERLMALWERSEAKKAESAFNAAMSAAQKQMRPIAADATNPQTRSRYASYAALDLALRPIYTDHGFGLSFDTGDDAPPEHVRVLCYVTHGAGHARTYHLDMPTDGKGAKGGDVMTKTHATGSGVSYGMRYLLKMIFNVAVGEDDDDGNAASQVRPEIKVPDGFKAWWDDMQSCADEGIGALTVAWNKSKAEFRAHLIVTNKQGWEQLKAKAGKVR